MDHKIFICECQSPEHQIQFWYDDDEKYPTMYVTTHLITYDNFFKRLWIGLKYAFGYKCRYGNWDEFLFKPTDVKDLKLWLNTRVTPEYLNKLNANLDSCEE